MALAWALLLILAVTQVEGRSIVDIAAHQRQPLFPTHQGPAAAASLPLLASGEADPHSSHSARQLHHARGLRSGSHAAVVVAAAAAAAAAGSGSQQHPIWVDIGGERVDATAGGLEYEDGEEAERSAPADGPLRASRLPAVLARRHLKIAPHKATDFAAERAAAWQTILDGG